MNIRYFTKKKVLVKSADANVLVLLIYHYSEFIEVSSLKETYLFMELGQGNKKRIIPINSAEALKTLDELRYQLITTSNKSASELLPTDDAFYQHVLS